MGVPSDAVNTNSSAGDQGYLELVGFLQDPKLEVQKMAAEGVLPESEDQDFLGFCQRHPRKVAKPLLRLVERAEADSAAAKKVATTAAEAGGNMREQEKIIRQAAQDATLAMGAGSAALQALVNLSAVPAVRDELVTLSAPRRVVEAMRAGWLEGRSGFVHWQTMLLANLTTAKAGQEALCGDEGLTNFLLAAYVAKPRPPAREGADDPLECIGKVLLNLCALPEGRRVLAAPGALEHLTGELADRARRQDVVGALRNLTLDKECHETIVASGLMARMANFLYPWERVVPELREQLPADLQRELASEGATLTADAAVRVAAVTCILGLCQSESGREYVRKSGGYEVMRAWKEEENDDAAANVLRQVLPCVQVSEVEYQEAVRDAKNRLQEQSDGSAAESAAKTVVTAGDEAQELPLRAAEVPAAAPAQATETRPCVAPAVPAASATEDCSAMAGLFDDIVSGDDESKNDAAQVGTDA
mmetsp:Transcript_20247/g.56195  ORF Transcript_20247/g.56195 Transcript_20247/m.56195 type:complete len:477 (+) Transcript_20247:112-1542(+)|eukprot:CAMPEP_0117533924 /NCGR_PEP_ID=MMETSP0784-20121206/40147_1 /TAXON_ID=39447 /ORGANISM="" /LENGTH=476 /DNA_ID=CAMNT_0005330389 /DNA_START=52 /DNA_END=1482 /DNA_ORIENTATION=-